MKKFAILAIFILFMGSCSKETAEISDDYSSLYDEDSIENILQRPATFGKKLPNPYSISNMRQAFENIKPLTKSDLNADDILPTHHYILFKPSCHEHYRSLIMADDIDLNSFPLDQEISDGWLVTSQDPAYSTNGYSHKWSYVPIERDLSDINCPYEILYDIFYIDDEIATKSSPVTNEIFALMEREAHSICKIDLEDAVSTKATKVRPSGNITYRDSTLKKYIGCFGMSVKAQRLAKKSYGHCDENGNFSCDKTFKYNWTYTVFFSRTDFEMRRDTTSTDEIALVFSKRHDALNLKFSKSSEYIDCIFYCEILRAACKYFYADIDGLNRPPYKDDLKDRMYIQAIRGCTQSGSAISNFGYSGSLKSIPRIRIFRDLPGGTRQESAQIYWNTCHELAHSVHWKYSPSLYLSSCQLKVKESFAEGIAWHFTKKVHPNFSVRYSGDYTGIVEDLVDNDGYVAGKSYLRESVTGFTIKDIENSVLGVNTWNEWADNIVAMYPYNPTIGNVRSLFNLW